MLWIVGICAVQLNSLTQIREQVAAGLRTGLQEISQKLAVHVSSSFEKTLKNELLGLVPSKPFESDKLSKLELTWSKQVPQAKITRSWALAIPDSSTLSWKVQTFIPPKGQEPSRWASKTSFGTSIDLKLPTIYDHWSADSDQFWANSIDSTLLLYNRESQFSTTESFACHPIFDPFNHVLIAFVCVEIIPSRSLSPFLASFFEQYFSSEKEERKDGIRNEFLNIRVRDENGSIIYRSSILANSKTETKVSIAQVSPYLGLFQLELGFIGKDAKGVAASLYQKNLWLLGGVFGVLLLLMLALYYTQVKSQKLDRLKSEFLANIGHELKTPLSAIKLANDTLRLGRVETPRQAELSSEIIYKEATKLEKLIQHLMNYSQVELEKRAYKIAYIELGPWWNSWMTHTKEKLDRQGFQLTLGAQQLKGKMKGDVEAIEEVLDILIDNAVKYSGDMREIGIAIESQGETIRIQVQDKGIGIAKDRQIDIFEKFVRIDNTDVHEVKGYGLGLSIAKAIVEAHGGEIKVESLYGKGSSFSVFLPLSSIDNSRTY